MKNPLVFVPLLDEGTEVWAPVEAQFLGGSRYRLIGNMPEDETWAFLSGTVVECDLQTFSGGTKAMTAVRKSSDP